MRNEAGELSAGAGGPCSSWCSSTASCWSSTVVTPQARIFLENKTLFTRQCFKLMYTVIPEPLGALSTPSTPLLLATHPLFSPGKYKLGWPYLHLYDQIFFLWSVCKFALFSECVDLLQGIDGKTLASRRKQSQVRISGPHEFYNDQFYLLQPLQNSSVDFE